MAEKDLISIIAERAQAGTLTDLPSDEDLEKDGYLPEGSHRVKYDEKVTVTFKADPHMVNVANKLMGVRATGHSSLKKMAEDAFEVYLREVVRNLAGDKLSGAFRARQDIKAEYMANKQVDATLQSIRRTRALIWQDLKTGMGNEARRRAKTLRSLISYLPGDYVRVGVNRALGFEDAGPNEGIYSSEVDPFDALPDDEVTNVIWEVLIEKDDGHDPFKAEIKAGFGLPGDRGV